MNTNSLITLLSVALPLIGAGVGYFIRHFIEKRREQLSEINRERREHYQQFVDLVIDMLKGTKKETTPEENINRLNRLYEFYKKYVLYASPRVINSFGDFFQYMYKNPESNLKLFCNKMTKVLHCMRKDLGLKNKALGPGGQRLLRALMSDYDDVMK